MISSWRHDNKLTCVRTSPCFALLCLTLPCPSCVLLLPVPPQRHSDNVENAAKQYSVNTSPDSDAGKMIPLTCDITKKDEIERLYKEISGREKQLHLLVNNVSAQFLNGGCARMTCGEERGG